VSGCGECRGECGEDKKFFHSVGWWLKVPCKGRSGMARSQIGGFKWQCLAFLFEPFKELKLPLDLRNQPLAGNLKIGVF
jgi:hypothetical protein